MELRALVLTNMNLDRLPRNIAIEFPLKVENHEKAISMVGGPKEIRKVSDNSNHSLELRLRKDPFHHPIASRRAECENVVLEIDLPAWAMNESNGDVQKALQLAGEDFTVAPKFIADHNLRFRDMADFQYYTGDSPFVNKLKDSIFSGSLQNMGTVEFEGVKPIDPSAADAMPPPRFSQQSQPFFYGYKQNPSVAVVDDGTGGPLRLVNKATQTRIISEILVWGDPIPKGPPADLSSNPRPSVKECIEELVALFQKRPCYTRRAIEAEIKPELVRYLRYALPYVSYFYRSGPWRGAYIIYGKDPSQDPSFSIYQVEHFRINTPSATSSPNGRPIHKFDGVNLPTTRMLQLCDVSDAFLKMYIEPDAMRTTVDAHDGWYLAGTMAVIRKVLRAKLANITEGKPPLTVSALANIAEEAIANAQRESEKQTSFSSDEVDEEDDDDDEEIDDDAS